MEREGFCFEDWARAEEEAWAEEEAALSAWCPDVKRYRELVEHIQNKAMEISELVTSDVFDRRLEGLAGSDDRDGLLDDIALLEDMARFLDAAFDIAGDERFPLYV